MRLGGTSGVGIRSRVRRAGLVCTRCGHDWVSEGLVRKGRCFFAVVVVGFGEIENAICAGVHKSFWIVR
jgi:hypothetical protein